MWHLGVPKILHIYWGGDKLPYIRYMTVKSFMQFNPDWKVMFWYPRHQARVVTWGSKELDYSVTWTNYISELRKFPIEKIEVDFEDFGFNNTMSEVHKSDFLRLHLLSVFGGVWSDMDILFFDSIDNLLVNTPDNNNKETFVCICPYGHSGGFLMATAGNRFFRKLAQLTKQEFNPTSYQGIGSLMFNKYYPTIESINKITPAINIGMESVYPHDSNHAKEIFDGTKPNFTEGTIGLHWYAGSQMAGKFLNDTNGGLINLPNNIIGDILKDDRK